MLLLSPSCAAEHTKHATNQTRGYETFDTRENNRILEEILRTLEANSPIDMNEPEGSDNYIEVTYDKEQCLSDHYTAPITLLAYTPSILFLGTMEHADTLLMGDEVIGTIHVRETNKFIKSSVDDIVLIPKEFEVTSDSDLECDMPTTTPLPTSNVKEENFDINSPLGEYIVNFLMENKDVACLPSHLVKQLFSHLHKNPSLTKGMSDEPLDTLSTRDREIDFNPSRDIEKLKRLLANDPILVPRVFDEPLGNFDLMSRSSEISDLFEELTTEFGLDDSIPTKINDRIPYDLEDLRACSQSSNHAVSDQFHDYILGILNPDHLYI
ncbi:hypothetical protein Tco_0866170 [Tanacetum coccineum]